VLFAVVPVDSKMLQIKPPFVSENLIFRGKAFGPLSAWHSYKGRFLCFFVFFFSIKMSFMFFFILAFFFFYKNFGDPVFVHTNLRLCEKVTDMDYEEKTYVNWSES